MAGAGYRLLIGNKAWSSWSLRPWLLMRRFGVPFEEINVRLRQADTRAQILAHSPAGMVPALIVGDLVVWDSLAIIEFVQDRHPEFGIWPREGAARAIARSVAAEMHSGFQPLRETCSMNLFARTPLADVPDRVASNICRIVASWGDCRKRFGGGGPFLFGHFSAADAMYAPVASRFRTYVPDLAPFGDDGTAQAYVETVFATPEMVEWAEGAKREEVAA
jgi:glutathione S-transferase